MMPQRTFRASLSAYAVLCGPWIGLTLLWVAVAVRTGRMQYSPIAICLVSATVFAIWLSAFRLELFPQSFRYRSLFRRTRSVPYSDVLKAQDIALGPVSRLSLRSSLLLSAGSRVTINWKVLPLEAARAFNEARNAEV
jgi:hypothetical protein